MDLLQYKIPSGLIEAFLNIARETKGEDNLHVESLALVVGYRENNTLTATHLYFPAQKGTSSLVIDQGKCFLAHEFIFIKKNLLIERNHA